MKHRYALIAGGCLLLAGQAFLMSPVGAGQNPRCFGEVATIVRNNDPNTINGTNGRDVIVSRGGGDTINAEAGNDLICSGEGNDRVEGDEGRDKINGGADSDTFDGGLEGGDGPDKILGAGGNDEISSQFAGISFLGNPDEDGNLLVGGTGADTLTGERGKDEIKGGAGDDEGRPGAARDKVFGNGGDDYIDTEDGGTIDVVDGGPHNLGDNCTTDPTDNRRNCEFEVH
jgi:Ca2+-binding RTX toxin-like protein